MYINDMLLTPSPSVFYGGYWSLIGALYPMPPVIWPMYIFLYTLCCLINPITYCWCPLSLCVLPSNGHQIDLALPFFGTPLVGVATPTDTEPPKKDRDSPPTTVVGPFPKFGRGNGENYFLPDREDQLLYPRWDHPLRFHSLLLAGDI